MSDIPDILQPIDTMIAVLFNSGFTSGLSLCIGISLCCFIISILQLVTKNKLIYMLIFLSLVYTSLMSTCLLLSIFYNRIDLLWTGLAIALIGPAISTLLPHLFSQNYQLSTPQKNKSESDNAPLYTPIIIPESQEKTTQILQKQALSIDEFESSLDEFLAMHDPQKERKLK